MRNVVARNIVLLPTGKSAEQLRDWSGKIADVIGSHIDLRRPDMLPHISLYNTAFPEGSDATIQEITTNVAANTTPFNVRLSIASIVHGYIFANADVSTAIRSLHESLIDALNPVRDGAFNQHELALDLTPDERRRLEDTGMILSRDAFLPHVTLARPLHAGEAEEALTLLPPIDLAFRADALHMVETGPNGTCKRVMKTFGMGR